VAKPAARGCLPEDQPRFSVSVVAGLNLQLLTCLHQALKRRKIPPEKSVLPAAGNITILFLRIRYLSLPMEYDYARTVEQLIRSS
jgi:hypothetical protein